MRSRREVSRLMAMILTPSPDKLELAQNTKSKQSFRSPHSAYPRQLRPSNYDTTTQTLSQPRYTCIHDIGRSDCLIPADTKGRPQTPSARNRHTRPMDSISTNLHIIITQRANDGLCDARSAAVDQKSAYNERGIAGAWQEDQHGTGK